MMQVRNDPPATCSPSSPGSWQLAAGSDRKQMQVVRLMCILLLQLLIFISSVIFVIETVESIRADKALVHKMHVSFTSIKRQQGLFFTFVSFVALSLHPLLQLVSVGHANARFGIAYNRSSSGRA